MGEKVQVESGGHLYDGSYEIKGNLLIVYWNGIDKAAQLGGHAANPDVLARRLLREMIADNPDLHPK